MIALKTILAVAGNPQKQATLVANARRMYEDRFHPDKIHAGFVKKMYEVSKKSPIKKLSWENFRLYLRKISRMRVAVML